MIGDLKYSVDLDRSKLAASSVAAANDLRRIGVSAEKTDADLKRFAIQTIRETSSAYDLLQERVNRLTDAYSAGYLPLRNYNAALDSITKERTAIGTAERAVQNADKLAYAKRIAEETRAVESAHAKRVSADQAMYASQRLAQEKAAADARLAYIRRVSNEMQAVESAHAKRVSADQAMYASQRLAQEKAAADARLAYIRRVSNEMQAVESAHAKRVEEDQIRYANRRTQAIIRSEREAAAVRQAELARASHIADMRERIAERVGRAQMRETINEALAAQRLGGTYRGSNRALMIQQLALAAEDASTQFGTRGLTGALIGAGNNLSYVASMANPVLGVTTSLGLAAATAALTFSNMSKAEKENAEVTKNVREEHEKLRDIIRTRREFVDGLMSDSLDGNKSRLDRMRGQLSDEEKMLSISSANIRRMQLDQIRARIKAEAEYVKSYDVTYMAGPSAMTVHISPTEEQQKRMVANDKALKDVTAELNEELDRKFKLERGLLTLRSQVDEVAAARRVLLDRQRIFDKEKQAEELAAQWEEKKESMRQKARQMAEETLTASERYKKKIEEIQRLVNMGPKFLSVEEARKLAEKAREEMQREMDKGLHTSIQLAQATQFGTANAYTGLQTALQGYLSRVKPNIGLPISIQPPPVAPVNPVGPNKKENEKPENLQIPRDSLERLTGLLSLLEKPMKETADATQKVAKKPDPKQPPVFNW